jgi:rhodanese-related sulfurtransferase
VEIPTASADDVPDPLPQGLLVLDVRQDHEWRAGHAAQTLVVCRVGSRSAYAAGFLIQRGIDAVNLEGGLVAWLGAGRALVADGDRRPTVL